MDGGGIRGLITLGYLKQIEAILRERTGGGKAFRLRDHYDLIGGTSTGSIIAAGLAIGLGVDELIEQYLALGESIFGKATLVGGMTSGALAPKFEAAAVDRVLETVLGERTLGSDDITTGLCIVTKRFDTNSVWPIVNAPDSKYYEHATQPNKAFVLRRIVRASTAAPTYFDPEFITLGPQTYGFIDGGISMHNNPALQLLLVATLPNFGFRWPTGADKLSILSIGTGDWPRAVPLSSWQPGSVPLKQVGNLIGMLMEDASALDETVLQAIGVGRNRREIDRVTGAMDGSLWGESRLSYERYQVDLTEPFFKDLGLGPEYVSRIDGYRQMDNIKYMADLLHIGAVASQAQLQPSDVL